MADVLWLLGGGVLLPRGRVAGERRLGSGPLLADSQADLRAHGGRYGTSAPEVIVGIQAAFGAHGDVALGNVSGSNVVNLGMILAVSVLIRPAQVDALPSTARTAGLARKRVGPALHRVRRHRRRAVVIAALGVAGERGEGRPVLLAMGTVGTRKFSGVALARCVEGGRRVVSPTARKPGKCGHPSVAVRLPWLCTLQRKAAEQRGTARDCLGP
jgi:hypothetical protein